MAEHLLSRRDGRIDCCPPVGRYRRAHSLAPGLHCTHEQGGRAGVPSCEQYSRQFLQGGGHFPAGPRRPSFRQRFAQHLGRGTVLSPLAGDLSQETKSPSSPPLIPCRRNSPNASPVSVSAVARSPRIAAVNPRLLSENPIPNGRPSSWDCARLWGTVRLDHCHLSLVTGDVTHPQARKGHPVGVAERFVPSQAFLQRLGGPRGVTPLSQDLVETEQGISHGNVVRRGPVPGSVSEHERLLVAPSGTCHHASLGQQTRHPARLAETPVETYRLFPSSFGGSGVVLVVCQPQRSRQSLSSHLGRGGPGRLVGQEVLEPSPPLAQVAVTFPERPQRTGQLKA